MSTTKQRLTIILGILGNMETKLQAQIDSNERDALKVLVGEAIQYVAFDEKNESVINFAFSPKQCTLTRNYPGGDMRQMIVDFESESFECTCQSFIGPHSEDKRYFILINGVPSKDALISALRTLDLPTIPTSFRWK